MSIDVPLTKQERFQATKWIISLLFHYKLILLFVTSSLFITLGLRSAIPVLIGLLIDFLIKVDPLQGALSNDQFTFFMYFIIFIFAIGIIRVIFNYVMTISFTVLTWKVIKDVRKSFFESIQKKPMKFHG